MTDLEHAGLALQTAAAELESVKPRGTIRLERSRKAQCWLASFHAIDGMPEGIQVPLPYTLRAGTWIVVSDLQDRFPDAMIFA